MPLPGDRLFPSADSVDPVIARCENIAVCGCRIHGPVDRLLHPGLRSLDLLGNQLAGGVDLASLPIGLAHLSLLVNQLVNKDPRRMNLAIGAYHDSSLKPFVLPAVREAILRVGADAEHEYADAFGDPEFNESAERLLFADDIRASARDRIFTMQTLGSTGALHVASAFLRRFNENHTVYISRPTYAKYPALLRAVRCQVREYPYLDFTRKCVDVDGMCAALGWAPPHAVVLLQASGHNPTGLDPSRDEWKRVVDVLPTCCRSSIARTTAS